MKKRTPRFLFNSGLAIKNVRDDIHRTAVRYREWRVQNLSAIVISEESPPKKNRIAGGLARHSSGAISSIEVVASTTTKWHTSRFSFIENLSIRTILALFDVPEFYRRKAGLHGSGTTSTLNFTDVLAVTGVNQELISRADESADLISVLGFKERWKGRWTWQGAVDHGTYGWFVIDGVVEAK